VIHLLTIDKGSLSLPSGLKCVETSQLRSLITRREAYKSVSSLDPKMTDGYAKIADFMGRHAELGIFRGFDTLNMQSLLYQQAEITWLEQEFKSLAKSNREHPSYLYHSKDWWSLAHSEDEVGKEQWKIAEQIQAKLEKYSRL
jgi:hypothetical protein